MATAAIGARRLVFRGRRVQNARPMPPAHAIAWLFDIDGTLLLTDGAAHDAFVLAVQDVLGVQDDLHDIDFYGRTEPLILRDILAKHGRTFTDDEEQRFWDAVIVRMRQVMRPGRGRLMPGIPALLDGIAPEAAWVPTLLTGNMTRMAAIKLEHFGLGDRFAAGAYGEEAADRDALARLAVQRIEARWGIPPSRCIVVGDTEKDVQCARAARARVIAVATGPKRRDELQSLGPDLALENLADIGAILAWARDVAREA